MSTVKSLLRQLCSPPSSLPLRSWRCFSTFPMPLPSQTSKDSFTPIRETDLGRVLPSCAKEGNFRLGSCIHAFIIKCPPFYDPGNPSRNDHAHVIYNCLLHLYCKCGDLYDAVKVFDDMPLKDTVSWNSLISGFLKVGDLEMGFGYFKSLLGCETCRFDHASLTSLLSSSAGIESLNFVKMIHALAILNGYENEITVGNALVTSYFKCKSLDSGMGFFDAMLERNVVTWTAAISRLAQNEFYGESLKLFVEMYNHSPVLPNLFTYLSALSACSGLQALKEGATIHGILWKLGIQSDLLIESALMDMYYKCRHVEDAWQIFESAKEFDEVSITVIITGLAQNGFEEEAIQMFLKMVKKGANIYPNMICAILGVFGTNTSQSLGLQIHSMVIKKGFTSTVFVSNCLMNMYSKCGRLEESVEIFNSMRLKNQVSWNIMIAAHARHGYELKAFQLYEEMKLNGVEPTDVTFVSLLHACSHAGLLDKGMELLESMEKVYGMCPRMEHYTCIVDMLGRAGHLKEAKKFIEGLKVKPNGLVWEALLGTYCIYGDIDVGKYAADHLAEAEPDSSVPFVSMANIYSSGGLWGERAGTIKKMKVKGMAK